MTTKLICKVDGRDGKIKNMDKIGITTSGHPVFRVVIETDSTFVERIISQNRKNGVEFVI